MSRAVYRYVVPVDDEWHSIVLQGPLLHVDARAVSPVEVWALHDDAIPEWAREFRVFGTGHPLPDDAGVHVGSVIVENGVLVWHLFERAS